MSADASFPDDVAVSRLYFMNSTYSAFMKCFLSGQNSLIYTFLFTVNIVVLFPLCVFILHHGVQDWRKRRSSSSISHSDCFTYHMVTMELTGVIGCLIWLCGIHRKEFCLIDIASYFLTLDYSGQQLFNVLTCMERYLAVMHPVIYMRLKNDRGVRIRNVVIGCVWFYSCASMIVMAYGADQIVSFCILALTVLVTSFCTLSVLCALIRPGPGDKSGDQNKVDRTKHKAFQTITVIFAMLLLRLITGVIWNVSYISGDEDCVMMTLDTWFYLPSSLVLPLLLLHRAGKFKCCGI